MDAVLPGEDLIEAGLKDLQAGRETIAASSVSIGGLSASVAISGLTPFYVSLYQINAVVPNGVPAGTADLTVQSNGVTSNIAKVAVR